MQVLGLSPSEFWHLTYEEFYALAEIQYQQDRRWDLRFDLVARVTAQAFGGEKGLKPGHFFSGDDAPDPSGDFEMTPEQTRSAVKTFAKRFKAPVAAPRPAKTKR